MGLCPPEEMIWSKAFVQERERFDGADVLHVFRTLGRTLSWDRLSRASAGIGAFCSARSLPGFCLPGDETLCRAGSEMN